MFIKHFKDCPEFISGDGAVLREIVNAKKGKFAFNYSLAHAIVKPASSTKAHVLRTSETYYIIEGKARMYINEETCNVEAGDFIDIPPDSKQYIQNTGKTDLIFLCIVQPGWASEDEKIL